MINILVFNFTSCQNLILRKLLKKIFISILNEIVLPNCPSPKPNT